MLWTGGWDSTFRLLQLARQGAVITPHYIIDKSRGSCEIEMQAMHEIREEVHKRYPESSIREIEFVRQPDIPVCKDFEEAHQRLLSRGWIGSQYIYIASYCRQNNIQNMELSLERPLSENNMRSVIPCTENTETNSDGHRLIASNTDEDLRCLFGPFSFPVISMTKLDMLTRAEEWGALDIMNKTWFCHYPLLGKPCGSCNPCMNTFEDGLVYRFPFLSRVRYTVKKKILAYPGFHRFLRKLKYGNRAH